MQLSAYPLPHKATSIYGKSDNGSPQLKAHAKPCKWHIKCYTHLFLQRSIFYITVSVSSLDLLHGHLNATPRLSRHERTPKIPKASKEKYEHQQGQTRGIPIRVGCYTSPFRWRVLPILLAYSSINHQPISSMPSTMNPCQKLIAHQSEPPLGLPYLVIFNEHQRLFCNLHCSSSQINHHEPLSSITTNQWLASSTIISHNATHHESLLVFATIKVYMNIRQQNTNHSPPPEAPTLVDQR